MAGLYHPAMRGTISGLRGGSESLITDHESSTQNQEIRSLRHSVTRALVMRDS
jgi:hypothetical protein